MTEISRKFKFFFITSEEIFRNYNGTKFFSKRLRKLIEEKRNEGELK